MYLLAPCSCQCSSRHRIRTLRLETLVCRVTSPSHLLTSFRIVDGFVEIGQKKMAKFHVRRLPLMFPVVVVLGFILWKWANGTASTVPNLDCRIGSKVFADGSSHCFTSIRKLGNHKSSERLRCFNSSKGIKSGNPDNPDWGHRNKPRPQCSLCKNTARYRTR